MQREREEKAEENVRRKMVTCEMRQEERNECKSVGARDADRVQ